MINLSQVRDNEILLDPFCGTGTILQEALLKNIDVIGVDVDDEMVNNCKANLKWLVKRYNIKNKWKIIRGDSSELSKFVDKVNAIVTEPYLGPFFREKKDKKDILALLPKLEELYFKFLKEARKVVKNRLIILMPRFNTKQGVVRLDFDKIIKISGFRISNITDNVKLPIIYKKEGSKIDREIYVLE